MVRINVSNMFKLYAPNYVSASAAELGDNAGSRTWSNALEIAGERDAWLVSNVHETAAAVREWASETGAWDDDEICAWSIPECLALLVQNVAADLREHFEQDCEVDTYAVIAAYNAADESCSNFDWSQSCAAADKHTGGYGHDLIAEWMQ